MQRVFLIGRLLAAMLILGLGGGIGGEVRAQGSPANAGAIWGQDSITNLPCVIAPFGGSATCGLPINIVVTSAGVFPVTASAGSFADGWNLTLGQKSDLQSPWNLTSAGTEMQAIAAIAIAANNPLRYTSTLGGTLTTGSTSGVFVTALAASSNARNGCSFQNTSASMEYVSFQATPTTGGSFQVAAGQTINCATGAMGVLQDKFSVAPSTNGAQTFVLYYQGN